MWTEDCFNKVCSEGKIELTPVVCPKMTFPSCPRQQAKKVSDGCCQTWKCDCKYLDPWPHIPHVDVQGTLISHKTCYVAFRSLWFIWGPPLHLFPRCSFWFPGGLYLHTGGRAVTAASPDHCRGQLFLRSRPPRLLCKEHHCEIS